MVVQSVMRQRLVRIGRIALLSVALLPLASSVALACLCDQLAPRDAARSAASVFTGIARGRGAAERATLGEAIEFTVETVYKGDVPSRWSVTVEASSCAYVFSEGERYTVFATSDARTNLCMGNVNGAIDPASYGVTPLVVYASDPRSDLPRDAVLLLFAAAVAVALSALVVKRHRGPNA